MSYGWLSKQGGGPLLPRWAGGFGGGDPNTLILQLDMTDGTLTPTVGTAPSLVRENERYYLQDFSEVAIAKVASNVVAGISYAPYLTTTDGGVYIGAAVKNECLASEDPTTAVWTSVGTPTSLNYSVGLWGSVV